MSVLVDVIIWGLVAGLGVVDVALLAERLVRR